MHEPIPATVDEKGRETHPAWGMIGISRVTSTPGAVLFDSDIKHQHSIVVRISEGERERDLKRDWLRPRKQLIEVQMSEAQWAAFVSSVGSGSGVPCTIRARENNYDVPGLEFEPRLQHSMDEVRRAGDEALAEIRRAFEAVKEKPNKGNLRHLEAMIENAPSNMQFAAKSLSEHAEGVVQKARVDIESMVLSKAEQLGIDPAELGELPQLTEGER